MKIEEELNFDELNAFYIFANTPYYLYNNFKKDNSIKTISKKYSTSNMIKEFNKTCDVISNDIEQKVKIYALLIALTYKEYSETKDFFGKLEKYRFKWAKELKSIIIGKYKITQQITVDVSSSIFDFLTKSKIDSASNTFLKEHKIDIKIKGEPK